MGKSLDICYPSQLQKVSKGKNPCEDRISCLPDEILYFIQSLLDYKKVSQMSILSRRWLNLWMHAPVLHFGSPVLLDVHLRAPFVPDGRNQKRKCDHCIVWKSRVPDRRNQKRNCDKFVNWMSRVSQMHKGHNSNELRVSYTLYKCYKKDFDSWWEDTQGREFQCLELNFLSIDDCQDTVSVFPDRLISFCSDCLFWTLSSDAFRSSGVLEFSGFKSLKSLYLKGILIIKKSIDFFLLNCPFLERLEVVGSPVLVCLVISGQSLALKYLKIEECDNLISIDVSNCNIVSLKISAPPFLLSLKQLPMLIELSIDRRIPYICGRDFLCHSQLKTLTLGIEKPKDMAKFSEHTSRLTKLTRLVINVNASGDKSLTWLISFINDCPLLEEFVLTLNWTKPWRSSKKLKKKAERCSLKHLKVVEFLGYYGRASDVELIVHLMENGDNLEKVIVDPWNPQHIEHRYEEEAEARILALQQLKEYVPPLVELIIR